MDFFNQILFGPNIFLTKKTSMTTTITTIEMGFDTIEINLVSAYFLKIGILFIGSPRTNWIIPSFENLWMRFENENLQKKQRNYHKTVDMETKSSEHEIIFHISYGWSQCLMTRAITQESSP